MTPAPEGVMDVFLAPGELWFGDALTRIHTILGSCVAITVWHPHKLLGGMCHYVLPEQPNHRPTHLNAPDPYYASDALDCLLDEIRRSHSQPHEFRVKLFGGGSMFPDVMATLQARGHHARDTMDIAGRNIDAGRSLMKRHGLHVSAEHLGGNGHRSIVFDVWTGDVWVRHQEPRHHD